MAPDALTGIVPLVDWAATIVLFPPDTSSILAVFHLAGLLFDLAAIAPGLYHCYTLLIVRKRKLYTQTGGRAGWRPMPRETLALCLTLFVMCDFCWHAALLVGMGFPNTAHAFHNFRYCLVYAGLVQYLVGVMYSIPTASRRALIQALGGGQEDSGVGGGNARSAQNVVDSSSGGAVISPFMSKRSWTRWWALTILSVPVPSPYLLNGFLVTSILFPMIITITLSFLIANAWTNETTLALQACLWATWATLAIAFGMAVFVFGNQLVLLFSQTIHSHTQRERSRSALRKTASTLNQSGNLRTGGMRPSTSSSNVTLESSVRLQHKASISGMPARSASLSVTADGHVVSGPVSSVTADMVAVFPLPTQLSRSAPPQTRQPLANTHSDEVAAPTEWNPLSPGPLSSPSSSIQSELAPIVPPTESTRVLGVAVDAHLDELADEPGDEINSKSVIAVVGGARKARGSQSSTSSSTSKGNSQTSDAGSPKQSSTALSDSGFGASASVGGGGTGKPSSLKTSSVGKVLYSRAGVSDASGTPALQAVGSGSESQLHRSTQRSGPTGSVNQLAASTTPPHAGKPRSVTISTSHVASLPSGLQQSVNISSGSFAKPLERTGQSGLLRTVTFSLLLAGQARDARLDSTTAAGAGVDLNLSVSSTLSDAQVALMRRRLTQGKQLNKAKTRMQVAVACILLVSLAFAGISCFQVFGMLELMSTGDGGVGNAHGLRAWLFWVPCITHIIGGAAMAVPVLWSLAWESVRGVGNGASAAGGGLVRSPTL